MPAATLLLTENEAAQRLGVTVQAFRRRKLRAAGTYTPPKEKPIPLYAQTDVDQLGQ